MCGRQVFALIVLNLEMDWDDVFVFYAIDGSDSTLQFDGLGDG